MDTQAIGRRIREAREALRMKQIALADAIGVRSTTMWRYETGAIVPSADVLDRIAHALGVSSHYLLRGDGETVRYVDAARHRKDPVVEEVIVRERCSVEEARLLRAFDWTSLPRRFYGYETIRAALHESRVQEKLMKLSGQKSEPSPPVAAKRAKKRKRKA